MKIAILTHTLSTNYGGLLQNYAMQTILRDLGHDTITLNHQDDIPAKTKFLSIASRLLKRLSGGEIPLRVWPTKLEKEIIAQNTKPFIEKYINTTSEFKMRSILEHAPKDIEAIIVGSDQVWNAHYIKPIEQFYLSDFRDAEIIRVAYAASFGMNSWLYTTEETSKCSELAKGFNAISVREDRGIEYCKDYLGVNAELVLDPTLLIGRSRYTSIVESAKLPPIPDKIMMTYVLDKSPEKMSIVDYVAQTLGLKVHSVMAGDHFKNVGSNQLEKCIFPSVEEWLQGFMAAEFVVTDSFHGTVFSIIFNKPFIAILNKGRGSDRFTSLLNMINLTSRLVTSVDETKNALASNIDYKEVNRLLENKRAKSIEFLITNLDR